VIRRQFLIENARLLEHVPELHDQFVEECVGRALVVLIVSDGSGRNAVKGHPTVALSNILLERDGGFVAFGDPASDGARIEVNDVFGDTSLVEPEVLQILLSAEKFSVFRLPFVEVQCY